MGLENIANFQFESSEKMILGDLLFQRIKEAILNNDEQAVVFMMFPVSWDSISPSVIFTIDKTQFPIFLDRYLEACEREELYEICSEIVNLRARID